MARSRRLLALLLAAGCGADRAAAIDGAPADAAPDARLAPIATGQAGIVAMAADAQYLYWAETSQNTARVRRMPLGGGAIDTLLSTGPAIYSLAVADGNVYTTQTTSTNAVVYEIASDGHVETLATPANSTAVALGDGWLYYNETIEPPGRILRMPIGGGASEVVAPAVDNPWDFTFADGTLYYTEMNRGRLMSVVPGEAPVELASGWVATARLAVDATYVYFTACDGSCDAPHLYRLARAGGSPETMFIGGAWAGYALSVSANAIQWGARTFAPMGGEHTLPLPPDIAPLAALATPDAFYAGDFTTGAIYRVAR